MQQRLGRRKKFLPGLSPKGRDKKICPVWESGKWRCGKKRRTRAPPIRLSFGQRPFFFFHRFPAQTPLDAGDIHIHHSLLFLLFSSANPSYPFFCPKEPLFSRRKKPPSFPLLSKSHQLERRDRTLKEGRRGPPSPPPFSLPKHPFLAHFGERQTREPEKGTEERETFCLSNSPPGKKGREAPPPPNTQQKKGQRKKSDRPSFASHHFCSSLFYIPGPSVLTHLLPGLPEHLPPAGVTGHHLSTVRTAVNTTAERGK